MFDNRTKIISTNKYKCSYSVMDITQEAKWLTQKKIRVTC